MSYQSKNDISSKSLLPEEVIAILNKGIEKGIRDEFFGDGYLNLYENLSGNRITSVGASMLFDTLKTINSSIKEIYLYSNNQIDDKCMKSLGEYIKSNKSIEAISLDDTSISDAGIEIFMPYLEGNITFKGLRLNNNKGITDKSFPLLIKMIELSCIEYVGVASTSITPKNSIYALSACNGIKNGSTDLRLFTNLESNQITSRGASVLFDTLKECNSVTSKLNLSYNQHIDDECMKQLGEYLQDNEHVEELGLGNNKITDKGVGILSEHLVGNTTLKELKLNNNKGITDASVPHLIEIVSKSCITNMYLSKASLSEENKQEIKEELSIPIDQREIPIKSNTKSAAKIESVDKTIVTQDIINTIRKLIANGEVTKLNRAKIMTAGKGRAGKTATIRTLLGKEYEETPSTTGVNAKNDCQIDTFDTDHNWIEQNGEQRKELSARQQAIALVKSREKKIQQSQPTNKVIKEDINKAESNIKKSEKTPSTTIPNEAKMDVVEEKSNKSNQTHIEQQQEEERFEIKGDVIEKYVDDKGVENKITLSIWDLGGQKVFYALHHLFLTQFAVYLVVFDMRELIKDDDDGRMKEESLDYIRHWLESIQMHAEGAPIFMIGTFKDVVIEKNQHKKINGLLRDLIENKMKLFNQKSIVENDASKLMFWPIDNKTRPISEDTVKLKEAITNSVKKLYGFDGNDNYDEFDNHDLKNIIKGKIPLKWTSTYDMMLDSNKNYLTFDEFNEVALKNGLRDENDRLMMLRLFHQLGMLLYFDKGSEALKNMIVLNAQWVVEKITMLIRDFELHPYEEELDDEISNKWFNDFKRLKEESIASDDLMKFLWRDRNESDENNKKVGDFLLSLMENTTLAAPWKFNESNHASSASSSNQSSIQYYLIPSNLRLFENDNILKAKMEIDKAVPYIDIDNIIKPPTSHIFMIDFKSSFLPVGFFDRVICKLVDYASTHHQNKIKPIIGNGSIFMNIANNIFRMDEDMKKSRIRVGIGKRSDKPYLILEQLEHIAEIVNKEFMNSQLLCSILIGTWTEEGKFCFANIDDARECAQKNEQSISSVDGKDVIKLSEVIQVWKWSEIRSQEEMKKGEIIAFLSHMKVEAGAQARLLKNEGERYLESSISKWKGPKLFLDSDNLSDLRKLIDDVRMMKAMIVLLSNSYLTRPWCLAELYTAIKHNIPIVTVNIIGGGYDFDKAREFLQSLTPETLDKANNGASKILQELGMNVEEVGKTIYPVLPKIIAQEFNASANQTIMEAQVKVIVDKVIERIQ